MNLQTLRIPPEWTIKHNTFTEAEPDLFNEEESNYCWEFTEDLLQLQIENLTLDLGWYPEAKVEGEYKLVLIKESDWENPLFLLETREKNRVIRAIEDLLETAKNYEYR